MDNAILAILACPICKGKLLYDPNKGELICHFDKLAYPIENKVPVMLVDRARPLTLEELK